MLQCLTFYLCIYAAHMLSSVLQSLTFIGYEQQACRVPEMCVQFYNVHLWFLFFWGAMHLFFFLPSLRHTWFVCYKLRIIP